MGSNKPVRVGMDLDQFLEHSAGSRGAGKFLKGWRKENDGKITIWLHPAAGFVARWAHGIQHVVTRKDRESDEMVSEVWGSSFVCWEKEFVLKKQMFREDDGQREYPPQTCPMCKLIDFVYLAIKRGDLSWTDPLFRFVGDDEDGAVTIHSGGFVNLFRDSKKKPFTPKQKKELREAGVALTEAFKENGVARCQYVFSVIDNSHPENGTQISTEAEALGNAMKKAIGDRIQGLGREEGNPLVTPVAFLWTYDEDANFDKKYRVVPMPKIGLTEDVQALMDEDPPDITSYIAPGNVAQLRAQLERYCLIDGIPWDDIFGDAEAAEAKAEAAKAKEEAGGTGGGDDEESETDEAEDEPEEPKAPPARKTIGAKPKAEEEPKPEPKAPPARKTLGAKPAEPKAPEAKPEPAKPVAGKLAPKAGKPAPKPEPEAEDVFECDHCEKGEMRASDEACPECGTRYDLETGKMIARPCAECGELIEIGDDPKVICGKCALVHTVDGWKPDPRPKPAVKPETKAGPKRRSLAKKPDDEKKGAAEGKPPFESDGPLPFNGPEDELPWQNEDPTEE